VTRRLAWLGVSLAAGIAVQATVTMNQLGPWWLWASNACRGGSALADTCGMMPLIIPITAAVVAGVYTAGLSVGSWVADRRSTADNRGSVTVYWWLRHGVAVGAALAILAGYMWLAARTAEYAALIVEQVPTWAAVIVTVGLLLGVAAVMVSFATGWPIKKAQFR